MNNKEFIAELSKRTGYSVKETATVMDALIEEMTSLLTDDKTLSIQGFGSFEVRKKLERVVVNPATQQRMMIPPKLTLNFKPSVVLKEKMQ